MASLDAQVDPKSAWALSEFREAKITLGLLDQAKQAGRQALGTGVRMDSVHVAYQGECLAGRLVVKLDNTDDPRGESNRQARWRKFGNELNIELEIVTEEAARAAGDSAFSTEEPSLWRDYEGRKSARDKGVLARTNRTIRLGPAGCKGSAKDGGGVDLEYDVDIEVQVPVEFLGQAVVLEALVSPGSNSQVEEAAIAASALDPYSDDAPSGGRRAGVSGGSFTQRLDSLFALSRIATVRLPVKRCTLPIQVVQPVTVTSRCCPYSPTTTATASAPAAGSCALGLERCLVALEVRNDHPSAMVTLHDVEAHVQGTARSGDKASQRFVAPGNNRVGGRLRRRSGSVGVGTGGGSSSAPLEGLEGSIEQAPTGAGGGRNLSRLFCASWVAKPSLPLQLAPGEVQGFVLAISPDSTVEALLPRRSGGLFETPVTFVWALAHDATSGMSGGSGGGGRGDGKSEPVLPTSSVVGRSGGTPTTSVHLARWQVEERANDEVLLRVRGQPRVLVNRVFEVSLRVRNMSTEARDLVIMFTESAETDGWGGGETGGAALQQRGRNMKLTLEGMIGGSGDVGGDSEAGDNGDDGEEQGLDSVPSLPQTHRSPGRFRAMVGGAGYRPPSSPAAPSAASPTTQGPQATQANDNDNTSINTSVANKRNVSFSEPHHNASVSFSSESRPPPPPPPPNHSPPPPYDDGEQQQARAATAAAAAAAEKTMFLESPLLPLDAAVPLGRLERGAECAATVRLTAVRAGLARLSTLCLRDTITGAVYAPTCPYEVFVES